MQGASRRVIYRIGYQGGTMEAQLWFSKGEKMEAWLGFSMDGVLVGVLGHIILQKVYGTATNHYYTQTSNHRCPKTVLCQLPNDAIVSIMRSQRRAKCESSLDLLFTRARHSAFSVLDM